MDTLNFIINFDQVISTLGKWGSSGLIVDKEGIGKDNNVVQIVSLGSTKLIIFIDPC